jgi:hypothetical protein
MALIVSKPPPSLTQHVLLGQAHVLEDQLAVHRGTVPHLVLDGADREPRRVRAEGRTPSRSPRFARLLSLLREQAVELRTTLALLEKTLVPLMT